MTSHIESLLTQLKDGVEKRPELSALDLPSFALPSARLITQKVAQDQIGLGESRVGGVPDLPPGTEWPRWLPKEGAVDVSGEPWSPESPAPLGFIAQIDLRDVPRIDEALPSSGWLYFFYDRYTEPWGFDPADRGSCRILYADCDRSTLLRAEPPADAEPEHVAEPCRVEFAVQLTLPEDLEGVEYDTPAFDAYEALREELTGYDGSTFHRLLGHPELIQNPMELECQLTSNGVDCGSPEGYESDRAQELAAGERDWRLLLQIDSDDDGPGWMWGDVGRIYFWVKRNDLASLQFQDAWLIFQCH